MIVNSGNGSAQHAQPAKRMSLSNVTRGRIQEPLRMVLYGTEKIGKSTFAANAPNCIFLGAESGTAELDVARFPTAETWQQLFDAIEVLKTSEHAYQTLAVDTLDWIEPLCHQAACVENKKKSIEDFGYGKGYIVALEYWRRLLSELESLQSARKIHVILLAHAVVKTFKNPEGDDYERYNLKIHEKASGLIKEWVKIVGFANHETIAVPKGDQGKRAKGVDLASNPNTRYLYLERRAAYDAGNRFCLPEKLPLDWAAMWEAIQKFYASADESKELRARVYALATQIADNAKREQVKQYIAAANSNQLPSFENRVKAILAEQQTSETQETH